MLGLTLDSSVLRAEALHAVLAALPLGVILKDERGHIAFANGAATRLVGASTLVGRSLSGLFEPVERARPLETFPCHERLVRASGPPIEVEISELPLVNGVLLRAVSDETRSRQVLAQMPGFVWTRDLAGARTVWSEGIAAVDASVLLDGAVAPLDAAHRTALAERRTSCDIVVGDQTFAVRVETLRGVGGEVVGSLGQAFDVTDRRRGGRRRRERMAFDAAARVAHGVGRALDRALAPIVRLRSGGVDGPAPDVALVAAQRGVQIAATLLAITDVGGDGRMGAVPIADIVRHLANRLRRMPGGRSRISLELDCDPMRVAGDEALLTAMVERLCLAVVGSGTLDNPLTLRLERRLLGPRDLPACGPGGAYALLTIALSRNNHADPLAPRPWEPSLQEDLLALRGLSLPAVYNAAKSLGGFVEIEDTASGERRAGLYLPELDTVSSTRLPLSTVSGRGTALVVDNDAKVRFAASVLMNRLGFETIEASNGPSAIEMYERYPGRFDVVLLDVHLPGLDGFQVLARLRALDPEVQVVLCTSYDRDVTLTLVPGRVGYLQKPFTEQDLALQLRWVGGSSVSPRGETSRDLRMPTSAHRKRLDRIE